MKSPIFLILALSLTAHLHAQSNATPPMLGLLRLKNAVRANDAAPLAPARFSVDDLSATGVVGASKSQKNDVDYVALDSGKEWSRPLRGSPRDVTFVSFLVHASQSTIVDIAGARLGFAAGPGLGTLQLMFDNSATGALEWKTLNYHVSTDRYEGKNLAALPTLTVRLDPNAGTWDLYFSSRLLADNLPLIDAKKSDRQFRLRAGGEGAWLIGLVLADENPLYEDANANGIDDTFEKQRRGAMLPASASLTERKALAQEWRESQQKKAPPALYTKRPWPDNKTPATQPRP